MQDGRTAWLLAAEKGHLGLAKWLVEKGADLEIKGTVRPAQCGVQSGM